MSRITVEKLNGIEEPVLTPAALDFLAELSETFQDRRRELLEYRKVRQNWFDTGMMLDFLPGTKRIRDDLSWKVSPYPAELADRRVEITGPVDAKIVINALNSGANVFMADFEDSHAPTWRGTIAGQRNLYDAIRRTLEYTNAEGKVYRLNEKTAILFVRPRGLHMVERHVEINGAPISASLFDFGLYCFHNATELIARGSAPYFYLPKIEYHGDAEWWNQVFGYTERFLGIPVGTFKATVLIETIPAAFEMEEILWELREHSVGLNCGRYDYLFSFIKKFSKQPSMVLPERAFLTMDTDFMTAYCRLLVQTCHRRGAHAMGGMSQFIPIKNDPAANDRAFEKVRRDKFREVTMGFDGAWSAHPGLVPVIKQVFDENLKTPNQIEVERPVHQITRQDLLGVPEVLVSEQGIRSNIRLSLIYLESWLRGNGCVAIDNLMEDAASVEICRSQLWSWIHNGTVMDDGTVVTKEFVVQRIWEELDRLYIENIGRYNQGMFEPARNILTGMVESETFEEFLTTRAYGSLE